MLSHSAFVTCHSVELIQYVRSTYLTHYPVLKRFHSIFLLSDFICTHFHFVVALSQYLNDMYIKLQSTQPSLIMRLYDYRAAYHEDVLPWKLAALIMRVRHYKQG